MSFLRIEEFAIVSSVSAKCRKFIIFHTLLLFPYLTTRKLPFDIFYITCRKKRRHIMAKAKSAFAKTMENGRLSLLPANKAGDTVEKLAPEFKKAASYMIKNRFPGIFSPGDPPPHAL
jgi:hypothetical protein